MTTTSWIIVAAAITGGIFVGIVASRIVASLVGADSRPAPLRQAAPALASLAMWTFVVIGLIVALGVISPSSLDQLPKDVIEFIPRLLSAAIIVIVANVLASFAEAALGTALGQLPLAIQRRVQSVVRTTIVALAVLLAVRQLGFDTTVINLAVAAIFFGIAGALMLLVALGGREVATEVASTRVLRRLFNEGDRIRVDTVSGSIVAVHPTAVEVETVEGERLMIPSSRFVADTFSVDRVGNDEAE